MLKPVLAWTDILMVRGTKLTIPIETMEQSLMDGHTRILKTILELVRVYSDTNMLYIISYG